MNWADVTSNVVRISVLFCSEPFIPYRFQQLCPTQIVQHIHCVLLHSTTFITPRGGPQPLYSSIRSMATPQTDPVSSPLQAATERSEQSEVPTRTHTHTTFLCEVSPHALRRLILPTAPCAPPHTLV